MRSDVWLCLSLTHVLHFLHQVIRALKLYARHRAVILGDSAEEADAPFFIRSDGSPSTVDDLGYFQAMI
jgi:hypothetical protein